MSQARPTDAEELLSHAAWLRALARSLVRDESAADDVVQDTLVVAIRRPPRESGALRGWLARVARHAAWKSVRGERRRGDRERAASRPDATPSAAEQVARIEMQRTLLDAVRELDEPYRAVVMLRYYDGKSPAEIARELGVAPDVVWKRLSRAVAMLRARLDRRCGGREEWAGALLFWLDGRVAASSTIATGAVTGGVAMGTKTVVAAGAAVVLAVWFAWPRTDVRSETAASTPKDDAEVVTTASASDRRPTQRVRPADAPSPEVAAAPTPRARTRGRVVDAVSGEPLAGAKVKVVRKSKGGGFQWSLETGADGWFVGEVEETARYSDKLEWSAVHSDLYVEASARGHLRFYEGPWSGPNGEDLGDVKLDRGVIVRGRVVRADGTPAPNAAVFATCGPERLGLDLPLNRAMHLGGADDYGRFEFDQGLAPTTGDAAYTVLAASRDGVGAAILRIPKDRDLVDGVVVTVRGAARTVRVLDEVGKPVAGAEVVAMPMFGAFGVSRGGPKTAYSIAGGDELRRHFVVKTDDDGAARFDVLAAGEEVVGYDFAASAPGFVAGWSEMAAVGRSGDPDVEIRMKREQTFVAGGRVVDENERPLAGAKVSVFRGTVSVTSGADGVFVFARGKGDPFGECARVEIEREGYAKRNAPVYRWPDDGREMAAITLERPTPIEGAVVDDEGRPVAGAWVWLWRHDASLGPDGNAKTSADGRFRFSDATKGDWAVHAAGPAPSGDGMQWASSEDALVAGGRRDVVVRLTRVPAGRATVVVSVFDAETSAPLDVEACMLVSAATDGPAARVGAPQPTIERGHLTAARVRPGDYALWVRVAERPSQLLSSTLGS